MKNIKEVFLVGGMIFGSIAGAGFASGKEVWYYFAQFGWICYPIIIITGILFFIFTFICLEFGKKFAIYTVQDMNSLLFHRASFFAEILFAFSNLILLASMFAGADSLVGISFDNTYRLGSVATAIITILIVWLGFDKIVKINCIIVPSMIGVVGLTFLFCMAGMPALSLPVVSDDWNFLFAILNCLMFVASNIYFAGFIFARLGKEHTTKTNLLGSILGSAFMVICLLGMVTTIYLNPYSSMSDMPLIYIANSVSGVFGVITQVVVWIGIVTTAVTLLYAISNWLLMFWKHYQMITMLVSLCSLIISGLGFSSIINYFYPVLGSMGVIFVIIMCIVMKKPNKYNCKKIKGTNKNEIKNSSIRCKKSTENNK